jgi:ribonuclease P protein component
VSKLTRRSGRLRLNSKDSDMEHKVHPERLTRRWEFQRGYKRGKKYWNRCFVVYVSHNSLNVVRLGITTSKKLGNSVKRNRVKRLIRESFRLSRHRIYPNYDIVVVGRTAALDMKCQQAKSSLLQLLQQAKILKT